MGSHEAQSGPHEANHHDSPGPAQSKGLLFLPRRHPDDRRCVSTMRNTAAIADSDSLDIGTANSARVLTLLLSRRFRRASLLRGEDWHRNSRIVDGGRIGNLVAGRHHPDCDRQLSGQGGSEDQRVDVDGAVNASRPLLARRTCRECAEHSIPGGESSRRSRARDARRLEKRFVADDERGCLTRASV